MIRNEHMYPAAIRFALAVALGMALLVLPLLVEAAEELTIEPLKGRPSQFPVTTQFSPVPSGEGWKGEEGPLDREVLRRTVDNIIAHGFSGLEWSTGRPAEEERFIRDYAQSRGMFITHHAGALELFGRNSPPSPSVHSPEYAKKVRANAQSSLRGLEAIPRLYNVFTFQDEPFHWGPKSFGRDAAVLAAFRERYGYDLPADLDSIRDDARKWLDVINFRSDNFAVGWRQVYRIIKEINPNFKTVLTHDSHNTFGAGYSSHSELAIDDVFHWGGDFSDIYVFDIYPYMSLDFRFGEVAKLNRPRISQTHYSFAQMRNLTRTYGQELGFWFGTFNHSSGWFTGFLDQSLCAKYWAEREMSTTAAAQGADFLLTGYKIPDDAEHWESLGVGLRLLQKAGDRILDAPKVKAKACMLFPRTQYIQLQEEYFNVGLSFELFLRAFGELDILHEEQVTDERLDGYQALVLFDVKLLPREVAERIVRFVHNGGLLIADCVPQMDGQKKTMSVMEDLFGVRGAATGRIQRMGHWVGYREESHEPNWANRPEDAPDESVFTTDTLLGNGFGQEFDLPLVSPRPATITSGRALLKTVSGAPGLVHRKEGKGDAWLVGFCLQDTYFQAWKDEDVTARRQLRELLRGITQKAGLRSHVWSSNPDIEASVRANGKEGFLFVINHEATLPNTTITVAGLDFDVAQVIDLTNGKPQPLQRGSDGITIQAGVALGETRLFHLRPAG